MSVQIDNRRPPGLGQVHREPPGRLVHPGHGDVAEQVGPGRGVGGAAARMPLGEAVALTPQQGGQPFAVDHGPSSSDVGGTVKNSGCRDTVPWDDTVPSTRRHPARGAPSCRSPPRRVQRDARPGQGASFAYPAINVLLGDPERGHPRLRRGRQRRHRADLDRRGAFLSGQRLKDMVTGAVALAEFAHVVAAKHPVNIALHTDHCPKDKLDSYMRPLIKLSQERVAAGQERCSSPTCGTGRRCRWTRTSRSPPSSWPSAPRPGSSWRWRSASSAARRTTSSGR